MTDRSPIHLFSHGTLRQREVQPATFGRVLTGAEDAMPGYRTELLEITDPDVLAASGERFHPVVMYSPDPADDVAGTLFEITREELEAADAYEVSDYARVCVRLKSGIEAWVYVKAEQTGPDERRAELVAEAHALALLDAIETAGIIATGRPRPRSSVTSSPLLPETSA